MLWRISAFWLVIVFRNLWWTELKFFYFVCKCLLKVNLELVLEVII